MRRVVAAGWLWAVSIPAFGGVLLGQALSQKPPPERFAFHLAAEIAGAQDEGGPVRELVDQAVTVRATGYDRSYAERTLAPAMRRSVAVGDANGDGVADLYIAVAGRPNLLLLGAGDGRFREITDPALAAGPGGAVSAAFSDYDRSGRQSVFVAGTEGIMLYRNDGHNSFSEATSKAGIRNTPGVLCTGVTFGDLNGDGFPELLVAGYTDLDHPPSQSVFAFPNDFAGAVSRLYRNNGDGTFTDITESAGLETNHGRARKAIFADFNGDERLDILLLRDDKPPVLYLNRGGWVFEDATWDAGDSLTTHAFFEGAVADFNRDGRVDLALWSTHSFRILINRGNARFERSGSALFPEPAINLFGFRGAVADLDGNGFDDVVTVDQDGRLRAFANDGGDFREVPLAMPQGLEDGHLAFVRLGASERTSLLAVQRDGRIAIFH